MPRRECFLLLALVAGCASSSPPSGSTTKKEDPELAQARRDADDAKRGRVEAEARLEDSRREVERVKRELLASRETATATDGEARISQELLLKQKKSYEAKLALYKDLLGGKVPDDAAVASATASADAAPAKKPALDPEASVAIVDGEPVARRELMEWLFLTQAPASIDTFLDVVLAQREAKRLGIGVTDAEGEAFALRQLTIIEMNAGGQAKLEQELAKSNMTRDTLADVLRANSKERALIEKLCLQDRTTKDYELRLLERARQLYQREYGEKVDVEHLLIGLPKDAPEDVVQSALEAARKRREQLAQGEDWQKVAKDMTAACGLPAQAQEKTYSRGDLAGVPEVEALFFGTPEGEISPPTRLKGGIGIVKVVRRLPPQRTFEEVKDQLVSQLKKPEVEEEELKALGARLRARAKIEKRLELK